MFTVGRTCTVRRRDLRGSLSVLYASSVETPGWVGEAKRKAYALLLISFFFEKQIISSRGWLPVEPLRHL